MPPPVKRTRSASLRQVQTALEWMESDPSTHIGGLGDQSPAGSSTPAKRASPPPTGLATARAERTAKRSSRGLWSDITTGKWVVNPSSSLAILSIPIVMYLNWEVTAPYLTHGASNPFAPMLFISHPVPPMNAGRCMDTTGCSSSDEIRYRKGYLDLVFVAYYIIVWSFIRQTITIHLCRPVARYFGIKKEAKLDRFGEQGYAMIYFAFFGAWGYRIMGQLPTWWYNTEAFWVDYPHWDMKPELKAYYLVQAAYWCQQLIVMVFKLEKPRKDYTTLIVHHAVTLWLIGWSYLVNLTLIGNAVYMSMDIPDSFLAFSKLLNYMKLEKAKTVSFVIFIGVWTYFRHYLNIVMLWSVWTQFDLVPENARSWTPHEGIYMAGWMRYQIFAPIMLLQCVNLFWYFSILRIAKRAIFVGEVDDERSDDEGDDDDTPEDTKED